MSRDAAFVHDPDLADGGPPTRAADETGAAAIARGLDRVALALLYLLPLLFVIGRAPADIAISAIALLFLARSGLGLGWQWLRTPWVTVALVFWGYLLLASALAISPADAYGRAMPFIRFVLLAAALQHWLMSDGRHARRFLLVLGAVVGFVILDCLYQHVMGHDVFGRVAEKVFRLSGPFSNDVAGTFLGKTSLPLLGWWFTWSASRRHLSWLIGGALAVTIGVVIMLTGERTALVTYGFGLLLLVVSVRAVRRPLVLVGLVAAAGLVAAILAQPVLKDRFVGDTVEDLDDFWGNRYGIIFVEAFQVWKAAPLTGVGLKNFRLTCETGNFRHAGPKDTWCFTHPHNPYLELLSESGAIGFGLFLGLLAFILRDLVSGWRRDRADFPLVVGASAALVPFLWPVMVSKSIFSNWDAMLLWLMIGLALALARPRPATAKHPSGAG